MHSTSLSDLIQMQCLSMATRAVRVEANSVTGHIYFGGGQIIHACVGLLSGDAALFEMLSWKNGTFTFEESGRAPDESVTRSWQGILLEAAQLEDESGESSETAPHYPAVVPINRFMPKHSLEELREDTDIVSFARSDTEGNLLDSKGEDAESLHGGFAYAMQLLHLVGATLGAEHLHEVNLQGKEQKALCLLHDDLTTVVLANARVNLGSLTKKLI